jgi:hypothetical protein
MFKEISEMMYDRASESEEFWENHICVCNLFVSEVTKIAESTVIKYL